MQVLLAPALPPPSRSAAEPRHAGQPDDEEDSLTVDVNIITPSPNPKPNPNPKIVTPRAAAGARQQSVSIGLHGLVLRNDALEAATAG